MRVCYVLLSPTFGMHQYTADLANRMAVAGHDVYLVTSSRYPQDRYAPEVRLHAVVDTQDRGLSLRAIQPRTVGRLAAAVRALHPDVMHITGPHLWNLAVMRAARRGGVPVVHTIHDFAPHPGARYGPLLQLWNSAVLRGADHALVHAECYLRDLLQAGHTNVSHVPLLHLFVGHRWAGELERLGADVCYEPSVLFFGRLERYKGLPELLTAWSLVRDGGARLVLAGKGALDELWSSPLPDGVDLRNRLIDDAEALDLFRRCAIVVLPYTGASQSALVAAAYYFRKPVIVTRSGALPEYVVEGVTGWIVPPGDAAALADRLSEALAEPERLRTLGEAGRAWYDEQRVLEEDRLQEMYAHLAAGAPLPTPNKPERMAA